MKAEEVQMNDVLAGDVLLSLGRSWTSDVIRAVGGGDYSHAAYFDGESIIEADINGVAKSELATQLSTQKYVDVFRFITDEGQPFSTPEWPVTPVSERAHYYLNQNTEYANNQIYLVGLLVAIRKLEYPLKYKAKVRDALAQTFKFFDGIITGDETKAVSCSEFVYRCFYEAVPVKKYGLTIRGTVASFGTGELMSMEKDTSSSDNHDADRHPQQQSDEDLEIEELIRELEAQYRKITPDYPSAATRGQLEMQIFSANPRVAAELVSPFDLQRSPNLKRIGRMVV